MSFILSDGGNISAIIKFSIKKYPDVWRTLSTLVKFNLNISFQVYKGE
jgi:hypothetical protein